MSIDFVCNEKKYYVTPAKRKVRDLTFSNQKMNPHLNLPSPLPEYLYIYIIKQP